jgi:hypothetical protein
MGAACHVKLFLAFQTGEPGTYSKRGAAPPTHSRSARCRSLGASSQKFAEQTKFHKVLVKRGGKRPRNFTQYVVSNRFVELFTWHELFARHHYTNQIGCPRIAGMVVIVVLVLIVIMMVMIVETQDLASLRNTTHNTRNIFHPYHGHDISR